MELNFNCVRDILIQCEGIPLDGYLLFNDLVSLLPKYTEDELQYTCRMLYKEKYISCVVKSYSGVPQIKRIKDITLTGHELLEDIRSNSVLAKLKEQLPKLAFSTISELWPYIKKLSSP